MFTHLFKRISLCLLMVVCLCISCTRLSSIKQTNDPRNPIQIGAIFPLSGSLSYLGELDKQGAQLAVKEINDSGGIHGRSLQLILEDSQGNAVQGVQAANKLVNLSNLVFLTSSISSVSSAIAPLIKESNKILLYRSTQDEIAQAHDYVFKNYVSVSQDAQALAMAAMREKINQLSVLYFQVPTGEIFNQSFIDQVNIMGGKVVLSQSFETNSLDLKTQLLKIKASGAQGIAFAGYEAQTIIFLKQLSELNMQSAVFLFLITPEASENVLAKESLGNRKSIASGWIDYGVSEKSKKFLTNYQEQFGISPALIDAAYTYDNVWLMAQVMKQCLDPSDIQCLIDQLTGIEYEGVIGKINFDQNRVVAAPTVLYEFTKGNWVKYTDWLLK